MRTMLGLKMLERTFILTRGSMNTGGSQHEIDTSEKSKNLLTKYQEGRRNEAVIASLRHRFKDRDYR